MSNVPDKMQTAKGRLALYAGFWIALACKMQWTPSKEFPVAATNGQTVFYNLEQLNSRPMGEVVFIALHEIGHPMLAHMARNTGGRDPNLVGIAMDIVLNELLVKVAAETPALGMVVPGDACLAAAFGVPQGLTWEATYDLLAKKCKQGGGKSDGKGDGKGKGQGGGNGPQRAFDDHLKPTQDGSVNGKPLTTAQKEAMGKEWQHAVQTAAVMAKQMGKLPGFLEEFIGELVKPKVDWRTQLQNCMARVAKDESSYRRFNRRHLHRGSYLPGSYSERIGALGYFCDTSGSIQSHEFKAALGAMTELLEDLKPEVIHFGQCDTRLHSVDELRPDDLPLPPLKVQGRGGTDMKEAFEWACQNQNDIDAFILQTDLYVPSLHPSLIPNIPVIVIVTTDAPVPSGWEDFAIVRVQL
jgi:predicted metal-dependent peptidase